MNQFKIIFAGPPGAGKTAAIAALSDVAPISTEASTAGDGGDATAQAKVAIDYGAMRLEDGSTVHLYATRGEERLDDRWELLTEGGIGLVLLIDNARPDPFRDLRFYVESFARFIRRTALVVGVSRADLQPEPPVEAYAQRLEAMGFGGVPVFEVDARDRHDIGLLVAALLSVIDPLAHA